MHNVSHAVELLVASVQEYTPSKVGDGVTRLQDLDLFVDVREVQSMQNPSMAIFISEVNATAREREKGINITCVGKGGDMPAAVAEAVGHWVLGVLPVLALWRGKHSCISSSRQMETPGGPFDLLAGPVILRGYEEGNSQPAAGVASLSEHVLGILRNQRLAQRLHWLELFACKFRDGSVDATCRWGNRDWAAGKKALVNVASAWPTTQESMPSSRQFVMLLPKSGNTQDIVLPTFWSRLSGKA